LVGIVDTNQPSKDYNLYNPLAQYFLFLNKTYQVLIEKIKFPDFESFHFLKDFKKAQNIIQI